MKENQPEVWKKKCDLLLLCLMFISVPFGLRPEFMITLRIECLNSPTDPKVCLHTMTGIARVDYSRYCYIENYKLNTDFTKSNNFWAYGYIMLKPRFQYTESKQR